MLKRSEDVFYYVTVMNENYAQPSLPAERAADVIKGMYRFGVRGQRRRSSRRAAARLRRDPARGDRRRGPAGRRLGRRSEVWSVTSFSELARDAAGSERWNRLHPRQHAAASHVAALPRRATRRSSRRPTTCAPIRS